jgi:hypothetical protein
MIYKISYVVEDDSSPGIIRTQEKRPQKDDPVTIHGRKFRIVDVAEVIPPKNDEVFLLVTLAEERL